ncbi:MAG TPA: hypothetical protein VFA44_14480 [Gaiellaceae bacterium]|nr:hypothetical protein [Gaiellaceae bacterium]
MRLIACAVLAVASATAAAAAPSGGRASDTVLGDGCLVVQNGFGKVSVSLARGALFGRFQSGTITIDAASVVEKRAKVTGLGAIPVRAKIGDRPAYQYGPVDLVRFRVTGPVRMIVSDGIFIDLSVVGRGTAWLTSFGWQPPLDVDTNVFSVDAASFCEDNFQPLPSTLRPVRYAIAASDAAG